MRGQRLLTLVEWLKSPTPRARKVRKVVLVIVALHLVAALVGWISRASWLPHMIAHAPNAGKTVAQLTSDAPPAFTDFEASRVKELRIDVGPPAASIAIRILDPKLPVPHGTVFVFHGIRDSKHSMEHIGRAFAEAGYRTVLVDSRGHGQSTGDWLSFGDLEGRDSKQVADALAQQGLLALPVGAYGVSYGGSVALQFARRDPRVRAVVSIATFTRMRDVVPLYGERIAPSFYLTRSDYNRGIDRAGELGQFRPDDSDTVMALIATRAKVLLVHGRDDVNIPWESSETLFKAAPDRSKLAVIDKRDHRTIMGDDTVMFGSTAWFDEWLVPDAPPVHD